MPKKLVLLYGDLNVDNICSMPEIPPPGRDVYLSRVETHLGGAVCNSAVVLQGLHQPTRMLGSVGTDQWGTFILSELQRAGSDTRFIICKKGEGSGLIFIAVTPNGERTMFSYRGANRVIDPQDIPESILVGVSLVELSGYVFKDQAQTDAAWKLIHMAESRGIPVSLDTGLDPVVHHPEVARQTLAHLRVCITGEEEGLILTGCSDIQQQAAALLDYGIQLVAIKLGGRGAFLAWPHGTLLLPAFKVDVKDTTGAGDSFSSGLIYGYIHGFSPCASGSLANALGGLATTVYGAPWIGRNEVLPFLQAVQQAEPDHPAACGIQEALFRLGMDES